MTRSATLDLVAPSTLWVPPYHSTLGPEVADLCESIDFGPDAEQRLILDAVFAVDGSGRSSTRNVGLEAPRQNIKTGALKQCAIGWLFLLELRVVSWTAHEFSTAQEAFRDMCQLIESAPDLDREVKQIHRGNGDEMIELTGDRRLKFRARTKSGGRGWTGDRVVFDEAMYVTKAQTASLAPTMRAVRDPQLIFAGSGGLLESAEWRRMRDLGRAGVSPRLAYVAWADCDEWSGCADEDCSHVYGQAKGCALDDEDRWWACNTALHRGRIGVESIRADRELLDPLKFATETLGWWEDPAPVGEADDVLTGWDAAATTAAPVDPVTLGVSVSADSRTAAVVACGGGVLEVVEYRKGAGVGWVPGRVAELRERHTVTAVGVAGNSPSASLVSHIPDVEVLTGPQVVTACQAFAQDVNEGRLGHYQPDPDSRSALGVAVPAAVRKLSGDGWRWSLAGSPTDISPLLAAVVARHLWATVDSYDPLANFMPTT